MERDMIFFSSDGQGLTSTSANHVANLAKEMIRCVESRLESMVFYSTEVALIGTSATDRLREGATEADLDNVSRDLHDVAKAKSLIAWLREAIKAKERMLDEISEMELKEYVRIVGVTLPEYPQIEPGMSHLDYFAAMSVDERNRYFESETLAAVLGKAIHEDGSFANAREDLNARVSNPRDVKGEGRDTLIYSYSPTIDPERVDEVYFLLQKQYREAQAEVNAVKADCKKTLRKSQIEADTKLAAERKAYDTRMEQLTAEMNIYKQKRSGEIGDYKIVIPPSLKEIYDRVMNLGQK